MTIVNFAVAHLPALAVALAVTDIYEIYLYIHELKTYSVMSTCLKRCDIRPE